MFKMEKVLSFACLLGVLGVVTCGYCPEGEPAYPQDVRARGKEVSIFSDLTVEEMEGVLGYMYNRSGLRIASWSRGTLNDSYIYLVEALPPRKSEALSYLDNNGPKPTRYAKVILYRGDSRQPSIEEYKVGPLPRPRDHRLIRNARQGKPIPWHARSPLADHEMRMWESFLKNQMSRLETLLRTSTDGYSYGHRCQRKCLKWLPNMPGQWMTGTHKMWINFYKDLEGHFLHPIGLQIRVDAISTDMRRWRIDYIWWRGTTFNSMEQFLGSVQRSHIPMEAQRDSPYSNSTKLFSSMNFRGNPQPSKTMKGPRTFLPDGRRYKVKGNHVSWQGWEFNFGVRSITGLHLNDIRFKNERIMYELSIQEFAVFYSGESPVPLHNAFFDTFLNIGRLTYSLIPGLDCPHHSTYFDMVHYVGGEAVVYRDSVCVFEHTNARPLRRHYSAGKNGKYDWVQGMDDKVLVLRAMAVVDNYEYIVDYEFHQHGGVEVRCALSGYLLTTYYTGPSEDKYGFQLFDKGIGPIHHHAVNFKVDLDVNGQRNRVETLDIKSDKVRDSTDRGQFLYANEFARNLKRFEMDSITTFTETEPKYMLFHNQQQANRFGQPRAYRIQPVNTALTLPNTDWKVGKAASWTRYHVAVTQQNDYEETSSSVYNGVDPFDPVVNFQSYLEDNENIVDEDLVAWVTLGTIHIPHTEDLPVVTTQNTQLTFHITPFNYFDEDPSLASRDNIRVTPNYHGGHEYHYGGVDNYIGCTPRSSAGVSVPSITLLILSAMATIYKTFHAI